jgi:hypothetical protein
MNCGELLLPQLPGLGHAFCILVIGPPTKAFMCDRGVTALELVVLRLISKDSIGYVAHT